MKRYIPLPLVALAAYVSLGCSGGIGLPGCGSNASHKDKVGAAALAMFEGANPPTGKLETKPGFMAGLLNLFIRDANACAFSGSHGLSTVSSLTVSPQTCLSLGEFPSGVVRTASITPGTYGASGNQVTVTADQSCDTDPTNPDAFAGFSLSPHDVSCTSSKGDGTVTMAGSGIWRNNLNNNTTEFYGTFLVKADDQTANSVNCSFVVADPNQSGGNRVTGTCEDSGGKMIDQANDTVCSL